MGNKESEIQARNNNTSLESTYDITGSNAIVRNYNQDWSRYDSSPDNIIHRTTNKYDKYNYSRKYGTDHKPNIPEREFSTRTGASGFGVGTPVVLSGISDSENTTNWTGTTHPIVKCNVRSPKSLNAFDNKTAAEVAGMYGEPEETGSLAVSSNKIGSGGHTGYCTYKVDADGYAERNTDGTMVSANVTGNEVTVEECNTANGLWIDLSNETDPNNGRVGVASCNLERGTITPLTLSEESGQPNESLPNNPSNYTIASPTPHYRLKDNH